MTVTTKEMIEVMQAFEDGKPIDVAQRIFGYERHWERTYLPSWNWLEYDYRIALIKPSWNWSHVSDEINFLVRHSPDFGGGGAGFSHKPLKTFSGWVVKKGRGYNIECLASYDPGTCPWEDSLVVRPGYVENK